ncbi:MAG: flagellar biosynthetic protein FliO [Verrucomicrobiae bacterium]|nr:flagellar biosynthetic protein FliO [Verrucomicrobiae bacterium]
MKRPIPILLGLAPACLAAAPAAADAAAAAGPAVDAGISVLRMLGGFIFVVALFLCAAWAVRRWQRGAGLPRRQTPRLRVIESRSLGPRHTLYVVAYDHCRFLVAASPGGLNLLSTLPEDPGASPPAPPPAASFTEALQQVLARS